MPTSEVGWVGERQLVREGGAEFFVEVVDGDGPQTVGLDQAISFDGVRETIEAIGLSLTRAFELAKPDEATAEFGLGVTAKAGKLTGLLVDGEGTARGVARTPLATREPQALRSTALRKYPTSLWNGRFWTACRISW